MSDVNTNIRKAFIFYLHGVGRDDVCDLAGVGELIQHGVQVELEAAPITTPQTLYYQAFSGRLPASSGFFDTLMPLCHLPRSQKGANGYSIVEESGGRDVAPATLPDMLRKAGWTVDYAEVSPADLVGHVQASLTADAPTPQCKIVRCALDAGAQEQLQQLAQAVHTAQARVGETGLLALLSDSRPAPVQRFVNVNNFLADMGVIERDEQSGQINWPNSLAYYAGHGQLWINLLGRDPQGAVHPQDEYEEVRDTLIKALPVKLREAGTNAPAIERIYRKEELYTGEYLFCAPDLTVLFAPGYAPSPQSARLAFDAATFTAPAAGTKSSAGVQPSAIKGFLLARAPTLASGLSLSEPLALTSALPSLLHALNVSYSEVDSPAAEAFFLPAYLAAHPIRAVTHDQELSDEDEELVINRLRDLGYV
jgi:hypothetical protein